jgi:Sugar transferases involved in lipopolysaccharide synthesis
MENNLTKLTDKTKQIFGYANSPFQRFVKRFIDLNCAFWGLIVFSPLILIIYIALKIKNDGPVIFKQERIGRYGKPFMLYKFRTMIVNSEASGKPELCKVGDNRLTKTGKFFKRTSFR